MTDLPADTDWPSDEELARFFHETYERQAPHFGYETRPESAVAWENVPEKNKRLMVRVAATVLHRLQSGWAQYDGEVSQ